VNLCHPPGVPPCSPQKPPKCPFPHPVAQCPESPPATYGSPTAQKVSRAWPGPWLSVFGLAHGTFCPYRKCPFTCILTKFRTLTHQLPFGLCKYTARNGQLHLKLKVKNKLNKIVKLRNLLLKTLSFSS